MWFEITQELVPLAYQGHLFILKPQTVSELDSKIICVKIPKRN